MDASFPPGAVAELANVHPDILRNWRFHGLIDGYGTLGANGRWRYSLHDVVALWAGARLISEAKIDRARAFNFARIIAPDVIRHVLGTGAAARWHASVTTFDGQGYSLGEHWQGNSLADVAAVPGFLLADNLVDLEAFAARIPAELRDAVEESA
jgi:hypothetical protein